jgi:1-acyl-sn-glycerol-3-phosphate acyltransferase
MRKVLDRIIYTLCAIWALIWFFLTMMIILIPVVLLGIFPEPKRTVFFIRLSRYWMAIYLPLAGIRLKIWGKEKFVNGQTYIVVCNHNSFMDIPISSPGIPGGNKTIAKIELARIPLFGLIYKRGSVLVDRKEEKSRKKSYLEMKEVLSSGLHMCIYPEGTRNKTTNPLKSFKDGAFKLAIETKTPIIPAVIIGTQKMLPTDKFIYFKPGKANMIFMDPITTSDLQPKDLEDLKSKVFQMMWDKISTSELNNR